MKKLWAKVTRKGSEQGVYPVQQGTFLGRVADFFALFPYGMHANLPPDQTAFVVDVHGRVIIGTSAVGRITVEEGEVVFFHPQTKAKIHFKASGDIDIDTTEASGDVNINTGNVNIEGDLNVSGAIVAVGEVTGNGIDLSTHTHPYTWTDPAGSGNTSPPN